MQQQAALGVAAHHQAYSNLRNSYQNASDAFGGQRGPGGPLGGYSPFAAAMNNSPLHNTYPHHAAVSAQAHHYLTSYPPNVTSCGPPCPSPPRDGKCNSFILWFFDTFILWHFHTLIHSFIYTLRLNVSKFILILSSCHQDGIGIIQWHAKNHVGLEHTQTQSLSEWVWVEERNEVRDREIEWVCWSCHTLWEEEREREVNNHSTLSMYRVKSRYAHKLKNFVREKKVWVRQREREKDFWARMLVSERERERRETRWIENKWCEIFVLFIPESWVCIQKMNISFVLLHLEWWCIWNSFKWIRRKREKEVIFDHSLPLSYFFLVTETQLSPFLEWHKFRSTFPVHFSYTFFSFLFLFLVQRKKKYEFLPFTRRKKPFEREILLDREREREWRNRLNFNRCMIGSVKIVSVSCFGKEDISNQEESERKRKKERKNKKERETWFYGKKMLLSLTLLTHLTVYNFFTSRVGKRNLKVNASDIYRGKCSDMGMMSNTLCTKVFT